MLTRLNSASTANPKSILIADRVFDGETQRNGRQCIVVSGDRIEAIIDAPDNSSLASYEDYQRIDFPDCTLLPGLIDVHVHISGRRTFDMSDRALNSTKRRAIRGAIECTELLWAGYTTVRDVGSEIALELRDSIQANELTGPTILAAGPIICQTGGHADHHYMTVEQASKFEDSLLADGVDGCRRAVRLAVRQGADLIKFCATGGIGSAGDGPHDDHYTQEEADAIVDEAHRLGRRVAVHAQGTAGILKGLRARADTIEHATYFTDDCASLARTYDVTIVPTVALRQAFMSGLESDAGLPSWRVRKQRIAIDAIAEGFERVLKSGVRVAAGSDFMGVPHRVHGHNALEPIGMVNLGMTTTHALTAATHNAAHAMGLDHDRGKISAGLRADIIAVPGDSKTDISSLQNPCFVMKGGIIHRNDLSPATKIGPK